MTAMWLLSVILSWSTTTLVQAPPAQVDARQVLEKLASEMKFLDASDVIYDRDDFWGFPVEVAQAQRKALAALNSTRFELDALFKLLKHDNPQVRTLALAALYARQDPKLLPHFVPLVDDAAETFGKSHPMSAAIRVAKQAMPKLHKQTVGEVATEFLSFYLTKAQFYYSMRGHRGKGGFDQYWAERKDRAFCASWFAVELARAGQGSSHTRWNRVGSIKALRAKIDQLPRADRAWTLLWINGEFGSATLVNEDELAAACKELGPDRLLLMLQRKIPSDDPDVQPRPSNNWPYRRMTLFVLRHAAKLLRPSDAEALLACEQWERDYQKNEISDPTISSWWVIAAAELKRDPVVLKEAFGRFTLNYHGLDRADLALALWRQAGPAEIPYLVRWFYDEEPEYSHFPHQRAAFLKGVSRLRDPENRQVFVALVKDKRFSKLDWQSLRTFAEVVNGWSDQPVVDQALLQAARHPLGEAHYHRDDGDKYPKETAALLQTLDTWRTKIKTAVARWEK